MGAESFTGAPSLLLGTYTPRLDDKGRLILPAKFRTDLGDGVVILVDLAH